MGIDAESIIVRPKIPKSNSKAVEEILQKGKKIILLNPFSNTITIPDSEHLFEEIAANFIRLGFTVVTACGDQNSKKSPVANTIPFYGNLQESYDLCKNVAWLIGVRSGFMDLMFFSGCRIISLYHIQSLHDNTFYAFDMNSINNLQKNAINKNCSQFYV